MPIETKRYMILFEGNEYPIIMPNIYSTEKFEKEFTYSGSDLGATYTPENYNVLKVLIPPILTTVPSVFPR